MSIAHALARVVAVDVHDVVVRIAADHGSGHAQDAAHRGAPRDPIAAAHAGLVWEHDRAR